MNLEDTIKKLKKEIGAQSSKSTTRTMERAIEKLDDSGIARRCVKTGQKTPAFYLKNTEGKIISSRELLKVGPLVISFFRGSWCPFCNLELRALQAVLDKVKALGANIVAITPQFPHKSIPVIQEHALTFDLLSDPGNKVARDFGLVYSITDDLREVYTKEFMINLPEYNGDNSWELPIPATYVVDMDGTVIHMHVDADYTKRMEPSKIVKVLKRTTVAA